MTVPDLRALIDEVEGALDDNSDLNWKLGEFAA